MRLRTNNLGLLSFAFLLLTIAAANAYSEPCTEAGSIRRVRKSVSGTFEYLMFEFIKPASPTLNIRIEHPPFYTDESGDRVSVRGKYFRVITFHGVVWTCDIRENVKVKTTAIMDVKNIGQFEGDVAYVIGFRKKNAFVSSYVREDAKYKRYYIKFKK